MVMEDGIVAQMAMHIALTVLIVTWMTLMAGWAAISWWTAGADIA